MLFDSTGLRMLAGAHPQRYAARAQQVEVLEAELQCVVTENVGDGVVEVLLFARSDVAARRRGQPPGRGHCVRCI